MSVQNQGPSSPVDADDTTNENEDCYTEEDGEWEMMSSKTPLGESFHTHCENSNRHATIHSMGLRTQSTQNPSWHTEEVEKLTLPEATMEEISAEEAAKEVTASGMASDISSVMEASATSEDSGRGYSALSASKRSDQAVSQFGPEDDGTFKTPPSPALAPIASVGHSRAPDFKESSVRSPTCIAFTSSKSQCQRAPPASACTKGNPEAVQTRKLDVSPANDWTWMVAGVIAVGAAAIVGRQFFNGSRWSSSKA